MAENKSSTITSVDKKSLDKIKSDIKENGATIILYHWNKCGHCISFMPVWDRLKSMLNDTYNFYDIEYSKMQEAPNVFGNIHSFPTIRMYLTDGKINYNGSRDLATLTNYIKTNLPATSKSSSSSKSKSSSSSKSKSPLRPKVQKPKKLKK